MVFGLNAQVLENRLRPVPFHQVPVLNLTMTDGPVGTISRTVGRGQSLISNEEIQVL